MEEKVLIKGEFIKASKLGMITAISYVISAVIAFMGPFLPIIFAPILYLAFLCFIGSLILLLITSKLEMVVTDKRVYGRANFGKKINLPFDMISSVGTSAFKGISVATSSGRISFWLCKNKEDVFNVISNVLLERQENKNNELSFAKHDAPQSEADELKKYKDLLDSGIITQEEFDAKKKQLLGL